MPHWKIKAFVQRGLGLLPRPHFWNELFQQHVTRSLGLSTGAFESQLERCHRYLDKYRRVQRRSDNDFTVFELGTGWYPTIPLGMYLCGAAEIWTCDIAPLLREKRLRAMLNCFCEHDRNGTLQKFLPFVRKERMAQVHEALECMEGVTPESLLAKFNIHVLVCDAQGTGLTAKSIDLIFSNTVLQYIPAVILANILTEFKRLSRENAVMVHYIDLFDQYSAFDKSITPINFLKFSNTTWARLSNPFIPMNRLRISDYRSLIRAAGFEIVMEENTSAPADQLNQIRLSPQFETYSKEDLLVLTSWLVSKIK